MPPAPSAVSSTNTSTSFPPPPGPRRLLSLAGRVLLFAWFCFAALILLMRWFVTTEFEQHAATIERLLGEATGIEMHAGKMDAGFTAFRPLLKLHDVTLARPGGPVSLRLPDVRAEFSWSSLWHLEPRLKTLIVSNPTLDVRRISATELDVAGFLVSLAAPDDASSPGGAVPKSGTPRIPLAAWILSQGQAVVENATLRYIDETAPGTPEVRIDGFTAAFEQRLLDWRASVTGILRTDASPDTPRPFDIRARLERHLFMKLDDPLSWEGMLYADLSRTNVAGILQRLGFGGVLRRGTGEARLWVRIDRGHVPGLTALLDLTDVSARLDDRLVPLELSRLSGRFSFSESGSELVAALDGLTFLGPDGLRFGPASLSTGCTRTESGRLKGCSLHASEIPLGPLSQLAVSIPLPDALHAFLVQHPVSGSLSNIEASWSDDVTRPASWRLAGEFTGLTLPPSDDGVPGFRNLSGTLRTTADGSFEAELDTHYAALYFPGVFREPRMDLRRLSGRIGVALDPRLRLTFSDIRADNEDATVSARGSWEATGGAGTIDISGELLRGRGEAVHRYLPNVVGDAALDYVSSGVMSGRSARGSFIVSGPLEAFPWDPADPAVQDHPGRFLIEADVTDGVLDFFPSGIRRKNGSFERAANFPVLRGIKGHLEFAGNRMTITGDRGESEGLAASGVRVEIPSFAADPPELTVEGDISGDLGRVLGYLSRARFLTGILGTPFAESTGSGPVTAHLSLRIPLSERASEDSRYAVSARVKDAAFSYLPLLPPVTALSGRLSVSNDGVESPVPFRGRTPAGPVLCSVATRDGSVMLSVEAEAGADDIRRLVPVPGLASLLKGLSGSTAVSAGARIPLSGTGDVRIEGESRLSGLASSLPQPLGKAAAAELPARFSMDVGRNGMRIGLEASPLVSLRLDLKENVLQNGYLAVGVPGHPEPVGFGVTVHAGTLDADAWRIIADQAVEELDAGTGGSSSGGPLPPVLQHVRIAAGRVLWHQRPLGALEADWRREGQAGWRLDLKGGIAEGVLRQRIGENGTPRLEASLRHLRVPESGGDARNGTVGTGVRPLGTESVSLQEDGILKGLKASDVLPDLRITIDDLSWGERRIGRLSVTADNSTLPGGGAEWRLSGMQLENAGATLSARGVWRANRKGDAGESSLHSSANIRNAGTLLSSLGIHDAIHDAPGRISADLAWKGTPLDFNVATLSGAIQGETGAGRLLQVEPGAGRLLSLLSMQHLLRRLTLDFSDVLARGFSFDALTSNAVIRQGVVNVRKAAVTGSAATVVSSGDIDLVNELIDMRAVVLPSLHAEGPALALAVVNPAISVGTLFAQWLLKDRISSALSSEYTIQGPVDDPVITKTGGLLPDLPAAKTTP